MTFSKNGISRRDFLLYALLGGGLFASVSTRLLNIPSEVTPYSDVTQVDSNIKVINDGRGPEMLITQHTNGKISGVTFEPGSGPSRDYYASENPLDIDRIRQARRKLPIRDPYTNLTLDTTQHSSSLVMAHHAGEFLRRFTQPNGLILPFVIHDSLTQDDVSQSLFSGWEMGSMILALIAAARIGVMESTEVTARLRLLLTTIAALDTYQSRLTSFYDALTAKRIDLSDPDYSRGLDAVDVGRLLIALSAVQQNYPIFNNLVEHILEKLPLNQVIQHGDLQAVSYDSGRSDTEQIHPLSEYASLGFSLFGQPTIYQAAPVEYEQIKVLDYNFYLPSQGTITAILGPYLYQIFELPYQNHALPFPVIQKIMQALEQREKNSGIISAMGEGSSIRRGAKNLYCAVVSRKEEHYRMFPVFHHPASQLIDPVFSMDALRFAGTGTVLAQLLLNNVFGTQFNWSSRMAYLNSAWVPGRGFYNGRYESDKTWNLDLDLNNHALLLEAVAFSVTGTPLTQPYRGKTG